LVEENEQGKDRRRGQSGNKSPRAGRGRQTSFSIVKAVARLESGCTRLQAAFKMCLRSRRVDIMLAASDPAARGRMYMHASYEILADSSQDPEMMSGPAEVRRC
jgi:hypothetical protein